MPGHRPSLDSDALARLRGLVRAMHDGDGRAVPLPELVRLADAARLSAAVTVDFRASRELGQPMIVLRVRESGRCPKRLDALSGRERQVAALVAHGLSNKQIAYQLSIALSTVKDHVHHILQKTRLPNRAAIAVAAFDGPASPARRAAAHS